MELVVRAIGVVLRLLYLVTAPLFWLRARSPTHGALPPPPPLLLKSVTEYIDDIKSGKLSSTELTTAYIQRIKRVNPVLNAVSDERFQLALQEADSADREIREAKIKGSLDDLLQTKPLLGVPFTVKESCMLNGMSSSTGCMDYLGRRATTDGEAVRLLREAGAVPLLVSNTPELCLGWETTNLLRGTTNNPYCYSRTSGGSSGGEAALLGSGASPFGVGSDIAGSVRIPAAYCGIFGHKPTPGVISIEGHIPTLDDEHFHRYLAVGPMTRHAGDLPLLMNVMAGENRDKFSLDKLVDMKNVKVFYMTEMSFSPALQDVDHSIKQAVRAAATYLHKECGASLSEEKIDLNESVETSLCQFLSLRNMPNLLQDPANPKRDKSLLMEVIKCLLGTGSRTLQGLGVTFLLRTRLFIPQARLPFYQREAEHLLQQFQRTLGDSGVFLYPVHNGPAHRHGQVYVTASGVGYTMLFNILGMPATTVPMGLHNGLPVAIQVVAAPYQDRLCLSVAKQLETGFGGWRPPY